MTTILLLYGMSLQIGRMWQSNHYTPIMHPQINQYLIHKCAYYGKTIQPKAMHGKLSCYLQSPSLDICRGYEFTFQGKMLFGKGCFFVLEQLRITKVHTLRIAAQESKIHIAMLKPRCGKTKYSLVALSCSIIIISMTLLHPSLSG